MTRSLDDDNTTGDAEDSIDDGLDKTKKVVDDAGTGAKDVGEGVQDAEQVAEDAQDGDQDTSDKASNMGHGGADALHDGADALDAWGLDGLADDVHGFADDVDGFTEDVFGKKHPPNTLPPLRYRLFFGKEDLMGNLENMAENALSDAMGIVDSAVEGIANEIGIGDYVGTDPFSSVMEKHSPFAEDPKELDEAESIWTLVQIRVEEGLNHVWRAELIMSTPEMRDLDLEQELGAQPPPGGLVNQIMGPIQSAMKTVDSIKNLVGAGDPPTLEQQEEDQADQYALKDLYEKEAELQLEHDLAAQEVADLEARLAQQQQDGDPQPAINATQNDLANARTRLASAKTRLEKAKRMIKHLENKKKMRERNQGSPASDLAKKVGGIGSAVDALGNAGSFMEGLSAVSDLIFGGGGGPDPDGPVYTNVPLDPAAFLGQTMSVRVSREFQGPPPNPTDPNTKYNIPDHSFTARYLTGVVMEMDDLGVRQAPLSVVRPDSELSFDPNPGFNRYVRLVVQPELAKLSLRRDHRVFNSLDALTIVREVLRAAGVYGFLPNIPGVGFATDMLAQGMNAIPMEGIPFVGNAMADATSMQFIKMMPPAVPSDANQALVVGGAKQRADRWTMKRELCVQYGETDLDFIKRLLEEEGIHFTFTCRRGFERLVLVHDPTELDQAETVDGRPIPYRWPDWKLGRNVEVVTAATERRTMRASKVTLRDFTFSNERQVTNEQAANESDGQPESRAGDYASRFEYPGRFPYQYREPAPDSDEPAIHYDDYGVARADKDPDRDLAKLRLEEERSRSRRVLLKADVVGASADTTLRVRGFPFGRDGQMPSPPGSAPPPADHIVIERIRWMGRNAVFANGTPNPNFATTPMRPYVSEISGWWVAQDAAKNTTPIRPARVTKKPVITSLQTATVVDSWGDHDEDEEVAFDHWRLARVRVRFHWDRRGEMPFGLSIPHLEQEQGMMRGYTCWCRVAQAWAGDDFGMFFVPRIGSEVVVAFENGDPDRPIVVGCLYDGEHPMPTPGLETPRRDFKRPEAERVQLSTLSTRTSPWDEDDGVTSEITFDDTFHKERVFIKAGRHLIEEVQAEHHTKILEGAQTNDVGRHHGELVEKRQTMTVSGNRTKEVHTRQAVEVKGRRLVKVGEDQTVKVEEDHGEKVEGISTITIKGDRELVVAGTRHTWVGLDPKWSESDEEDEDDDEDDDEENADETPAELVVAHDIHHVKKTKTDTITGVLFIRSETGLAVGQASDAAGAGGSAVEVSKDAVDAKAKGGLELVADKEVRIVSETGGVRLRIHEGLTAKNPTETFSMGKPAAEGVRVESAARVMLHTENTRHVVTDHVWFRATGGSTEATAKIGPQNVDLEGKTGIIKAKVAIRGATDVSKVGE